MSDDETIALLAREPYLVRRPSFAVDGRLAAIGFNPETLRQGILRRV